MQSIKPIVHAMVDIETLGLPPMGIILSIGAVKFSFEPENLPYDQFHVVIDQASSRAHGMYSDERVEKWWASQDPWSRSIAMGEDPQHPAQLLPYALDAFFKWMEGVDCLWAKGPDFDIALIRAAAFACGQADVPWSHRAPRDVRTVAWLADIHGWEPPVRESTEHNALLDAEYQARMVVNATRWVLGLRGY